MKSHKTERHTAAREGIRRRGITVREWSRQHGLSEKVVHGVLIGKLAGEYGAAHKAAVLLGIKDGVIE